MAGVSDCSALRSGFPQGPVQTHGYVFNVDKRATLRGRVLRRSHIQDPAPCTGEIFGRQTSSVPKGTEGRASHPVMGSGSSIQAPVTTIRPEEPQMVLSIEKHKVRLLINTGASFLAIPFSPVPRSSKKITV
jgi:hypothetical protein